MAKGSDILPGGYGPALLMPHADLPVLASLRAGETSQVLSRARDGKQPFGGHPSSASPPCLHCADPPRGVQSLGKVVVLERIIES